MISARAVRTVPLLVGALVFVFLLQDSASAHSALFESLPETAYFSGCGCFFQRGVTPIDSTSVVFASNYEGSARIAADGEVIELSEGRPDASCRPQRVGGRCVLKYRHGDLKVTLKVRATWICPPGDASESCEVVRLAGQISGHVGEIGETIDVHGECGC